MLTSACLGGGGGRLGETRGEQRWFHFPSLLSGLTLQFRPRCDVTGRGEGQGWVLQLYRLSSIKLLITMQWGLTSGWGIIYMNCPVTTHWDRQQDTLHCFSLLPGVFNSIPKTPLGPIKSCLTRLLLWFLIKTWVTDLLGQVGAWFLHEFEITSSRSVDWNHL